MSDTLLVVAKQPIPGQTKTRLCPQLSPAQSADLYECFLLDTLDVMRRVPDVKRVVCFLPDDGREYFNQLAPDMDLTRQHDESLGERLDHLLTEALAGGSPRAVVIDSDSPTLPAEYISQAIDQLTDADVVLGPTQDGGYYLIGMKRPQPRRLRQVQMSTSHVLADTLVLAQASNLIVRLLPTWYDIDTIDDLLRLDGEIHGSSKNGSAPATRRWLAQTDWRNSKD
jgi:rSAM/selenodomain-associated transferase 1